MIPTTHFVEQRERASIVSRRILSAVDRYCAGDDTMTLVLDIARLTAMIAIHCAQVDRALRPLLSSDRRNDIYRFRQEFGGLVDLSRIFNRRWGTNAAIAADPLAFRIDVHQFIYAIEERFDCEERILAIVPTLPTFETDLAEVPMRPPVRAAS